MVPNSAAPSEAGGGAPQAKPADALPGDALPATGSPAGEAAGPAFPDDFIARHDPAAQPNAPTPAAQVMSDAVLSSSGPGALAESRDTMALRTTHATQDGVQTVSIDLHPAELGHVGIELSFHDGGVSVQMTLARHETYEAFARDRVALEQQLTQSGITLGNGGLDLRFGQKHDQPPAFAGTHAVARVAVSQPAALAAAPAAMPRAGHGLLNIIA
jgi:hypothetical protein